MRTAGAAINDISVLPRNRTANISRSLNERFAQVPSGIVTIEDLPSPFSTEISFAFQCIQAPLAREPEEAKLAPCGE
jgi:hypothetical protein